MKNRTTPTTLVGSLVVLALTLVLGINPTASAEEALNPSVSPSPSISASSQVSPSDTAASSEAKTAIAQDGEPSASPSPSTSSSESSEPTTTPSVTPTPTPTPKPTPPPPKPPVLQPAPEIWGHRSGASNVRENTELAFKRAIASKTVSVLETDIHQTKDHVWIVNHDATMCGKRISKTKYKVLKRCRSDLLTYNRFTVIIGNIPAQVEIKPKKITKTQIRKLYKQARKEKANIQWSSFQEKVVAKLRRYSSTAKIAYITGYCPGTAQRARLKKLRVITIDLRYYNYGGGTNLACTKSLRAAKFAPALWTFDVNKVMYDNARSYGAWAVITDNAGYARKTAYPTSAYKVPAPHRGNLR